jgi:hypothetical protein
MVLSSGTRWGIGRACVRDGLILRWISAILCAFAIFFPLMAEAHRPGESYAYIRVGDGPLTGEVHIRASDLTKLETYGASLEAVGAYQGFSATQVPDLLTERLRFFAGGTEYTPRFAGETSFGEGKDRFLVYPFEVPDLRPADQIEASFTFMFDGPNPRHRTYLLMDANARLGLRDNEAKPSLVFGPGAERQSLLLERRPVLAVVTEAIGHGARQVLTSLPHLALLGAALLGLMAGHPASPKRAAIGSATLALGLAAGAGVFLYSGGSAGPKQTFVAFLAALLALIPTLWPRLNTGVRHGAAFVGAAFLGSVAAHFADRVGIEAGLLGQILPGLALGAFAALLALALVAHGALGLVTRSPALPSGLAAAFMVVGAGLAWSVTRAMV